MTWRTLLAAPLIAAIWVAVRAVGILDDLHLAFADDPWEDRADEPRGGVS